MLAMNFIASAALIGSASESTAAPIYLQCKYSYNSVDNDLAITLNEEAGTATVVQDGRTHRLQAVFSPREVVIPGRTLEPQYTINRTDLGFKADWQAYFGPVSALGKCALTPTPERKF